MTEIAEEGDFEQLSRNYLEMDETGKEKLKEVSEQILKIWATVNEKSPKSALSGNACC